MVAVVEDSSFGLRKLLHPIRKLATTDASNLNGPAFKNTK